MASLDSGLIFPSQLNFTGGELSPDLYGRVDIQKYSTGCKLLENFIILPFGGVSNRAGTLYCGTTSKPTSRCYLAAFVRSADYAIVMAFEDKCITFYRDGVQITVDNKPVTVDTPYTSDELFDIRYTQSADIVFLTHPNHPPQQLMHYADDNWMLKSFEFNNGPFMTINSDDDLKISSSGVDGAVTLTATGDVFVSEHVGALWQFTHFIDTRTEQISATGNQETGSIRLKGATWKMTTHKTWTGKVEVKRSYDNGTTWNVLRSYVSADDFNITTDDTEDDDCLIKAVAEITKGTCQVELTVVGYNLDGVVKITEIANKKSAKAKVVSWLGDGKATNNWSEGSWSVKNGFPSCCNFHQDRLVFGGTKAEPQKIWMSCTSDYNNFVTHTPLQSDDAITIPLLARDINKVRSLISMDGLITLTSSAEWIVGSGVNVMTPEQIGGARANSYYGSANVAPAIIGSRVLYIQDVGCTVRDLAYTFESANYSGNNISLLANHLFRNYEITQIAYAQEQDSVLWCVRDDGILLGLTYMKDQDVWGWHRHATKGKYESVCTIPGKLQTEVYFVVKRTINGVEKRFIERMAYRMPTEKSEDSYFVDCGISFNTKGVNKVNVCHLAGEDVAILADGNVLPTLKVGLDGDVELGANYKKVQIGLPYRSRLETLGLDLQLNDGSAQSRKKKLSAVSILMKDTRGGWVGVNNNKMSEMKMRTNENYGEPTRIRTGEYKQVISSSYDTDSIVVVEQRDPIPLTILSISPVWTMGG